MPAPDRGVVETRRAISTGVLTAEEDLDARLSAIEAQNERLNAFVHFNRNEARDAFDSRKRSGSLAGVPVAIKDNIVTRGTLTTCASRILDGYRSPTDAEAVSRLREAGAYVLGKTNLDEFAMGSSTEYSVFGPTSNPWDLDRVPGGSSGGSAAAVAAGLAPAALGSDTGGSVRQPAAFCGVLGLKPTWGRVSRSGLIAFASSFDQIGVFARRVEDLAAVLGVIAGLDPADSTSADVEVPDYTKESNEDVRGRRFGVVPGILEGLDEDVRRGFEDSLLLLQDEGAKIVEVSIPLMDLAIATYYIIANAEASANLARFDGVRYGRRVAAPSLGEQYSKSRTQGFGREVKRRIMLGTFALSSGYYDAYYARAQKVRTLMRVAFEETFAGVEFILTPTTPTAAFRKGEKTEDPLTMYLSDVFTAPANLVGIPALAIPHGTSREGLPLSLQVMGRAYSEGSLLAVANTIEKVRGRLAYPKLSN